MLWMITHWCPFQRQVNTAWISTASCKLCFRSKFAPKLTKRLLLLRKQTVDRARGALFLVTVQHNSDNQVPSEKDKPQTRTISIGQTVKVKPSNFSFSRNSSEWGIFVLILLNLLLYAASSFIWPRLLPLLALNHRQPHWWQFVTYSFCHSSWSHLSNNLFFLLIFGKLVEEEEGALGVITSYCVCAVGSALISWLVLPKYCVSVGASGAVFGLFTICVLTRFSWNWKGLLEFLILGQYIYQVLGREVRLASSNDAQKWTRLATNHIGHIAGSVTGILLVVFLRLLVASYSENSANKTD